MLNVIPLLASRNDAQRDEIRTQFDFERLFESPARLTIIPPRSNPVERLVLAEKQKNAGLTWVDFDEHGKVVGYAIWTDWDNVTGHANQVQKALTEHIRAKRRMGGQYTEDGGDPVRHVLMPQGLNNIQDIHGRRIIGVERAFELSPPLHPDAFAAAALEAKACDWQGRQRIRDMGAKLEREHEQTAQSIHPRIPSQRKTLRWHD